MKLGPNRRTPDGRLRQAKGFGILFIYILVVMAALLAGYFVIRLGLTYMANLRHRQAVEAASLAAAMAVSRIVVNDPYFGYISLSDQAGGTATRGADGKIAPVLGINTILGTSRLGLVVANIFHSNELRVCVEKDIEASRNAKKLLLEALEASIQPSATIQARDANGNLISAYEIANRTYQNSLGQNLCVPVVDGFRMQLGWLKNGGTTTTRIPKPELPAITPDELTRQGCYRAFLDVPYAGEHFYFAGVSRNASLVTAGDFVPGDPDGKQICSIIEVSGEAAPVGLLATLGGKDAGHMGGVSCAEPFAMEDNRQPGAMTIGCQQGFPVRNLRELLLGSRLGGSAITYTSVGGDYPTDTGAVLKQTEGLNGTGVTPASQATVQAFYDWLRNARTQPRLDSLKRALVKPLSSYLQTSSSTRIGALMLCNFDQDGNMIVLAENRRPFQYRIVSEGQLYFVCPQGIKTPFSTWSVNCYDHVRQRSLSRGGKHDGQPMAVNRVDFETLSDDAKALVRRGQAVDFELTL